MEDTSAQQIRIISNECDSKFKMLADPIEITRSIINSHSVRGGDNRISILNSSSCTFPNRDASVTIDTSIFLKNCAQQPGLA